MHVIAIIPYVHVTHLFFCSKLQCLISICPNFSGLINVILLTLQRNRLTSLDQSCFYGLKSLKKLDLSRQKINHLEPYAFQVGTKILSKESVSILFLDFHSKKLSWESSKRSLHVWIDAFLNFIKWSNTTNLESFNLTIILYTTGTS